MAEMGLNLSKLAKLQIGLNESNCKLGLSMFHAPILTIEVQSKMAKNIGKKLLVWLNYIKRKGERIKRNIFLCWDEHLHILRILSCQDDADAG